MNEIAPLFIRICELERRRPVKYIKLLFFTRENVNVKTAAFVLLKNKFTIFVVTLPPFTSRGMAIGKRNWSCTSLLISFK